MDKTTIAILGIIVILAAGISYQLGVSSFQKQVDSKTQQITELERSLEEAMAEAQKAPAPQPVSGTQPTSGDEINCLACHDLDQTKGFHVPQTIMKIDERDGKRRRTCVDCHGPDGPPWSADTQQTPLSMLPFDETIGTNGLIDITSEVPHGIHKQKLDSGIVKCQDCHGEGTQMVIPEADTGKGQVLVCQNCKFHPENGNYITIHVELAGKKCTACHTGGVVEVHKAKTMALGQV